MKTLRLLVAACASLLVVACTEKQPEETYEVSVTPGQVLLMSSGAGQSVNLTAGGDWTASADAAWIRVEPASGSTDAKVMISAEPNEGAAGQLAELRQGTVTFAGGGSSVTVKVSQKAEETVLVVLGTPDPAIFPAEGGKLAVKVEYNVSYRVEGLPEWIIPSTKAVAVDDLTYEVKANTQPSERAADITFTTASGASRILTVKQQSASRKIATAQDLKDFSTAVNSGDAASLQLFDPDGDGVYVLEADIDMKGISWTPIGACTYVTGSYSGNPFTGVFDGGNHSISNLSYTIPADAPAQTVGGLFGTVYQGTVKNVKIASSCEFKSLAANESCLGAIAGHVLNSVVENCENNAPVSYDGGTIDKKRQSIGGIIGCVAGNNSADPAVSVPSVVRKCTNYGPLSSRNQLNSNNGGTGVSLGGVAGFCDCAKAADGSYPRNNIIESCVNRGSVSGQATRIGGVVASLNSATEVDDCDNYGEVNGSEENVNSRPGGIASCMNAYTYVNRCRNYGTVKYTGSKSNYGLCAGIVGQANDKTNTIIGCENYGTILTEYFKESAPITGIIVSNCNSVAVTVRDNKVEGFIGPVNETETHKVVKVTKSNYEQYISMSAAKNAAAIFSGNYCTVEPEMSLTFSGGQGTESDPYQIATVLDLQSLSALVNSADKAEAYKTRHYRQTADIDMSSAGDFTPIGASTTNNFRGVYDGAGHKISNLTINTSTERASALFGNCGTGTVIRDLTLEHVKVSSSSYYTAAFVGFLYAGEISGCSFTGEVWGTGALNNVSYLGGIVGRSQNSTVRDCVVAGNVSTTSNHAGGVVGESQNSTITGCRLSKGCSVICNYYAGGIAGYASGESTMISSCVCEGNVSGQNWNVGGIVSCLIQGTVKDCVQSSGSIVTAGQHSVGGIVGGIITSSGTGTVTALVDNCAAYGDIHGAYQVGGIVGLANIANDGQSAIIRNCVCGAAEIIAQGKNTYNYALAGGIAGYLQGNGTTQVLNCCSMPAMISAIKTGGSGGFAGIVGYQSTKTTLVDNCYTAVTPSELLYANAPVTASSLSYYGSIIGRCSVASPYNRCYHNESLRLGGAGSLENTDACQAMTAAQMTDGTLLSRLNGAVSSVSGAVEWVALPGGLPVISGIPADTNPQNSSKKRVSIIGDSISTFQGWMPLSYTSHYPNANACNVTSVDKTWWHLLIYKYMKNAKLDMNLSFSNSTVTQNQDAANVNQYWYGHDFCSRFVECSGMGRPDIIVIHGGTNDYGHNYGELLAPGMEMRTTTVPSAAVLDPIFKAADAATTIAASEALPYDTFCAAYTKLLRMMKVRYPDVKIICIIGDSVTPGIQGAIKAIAEHYGAKVEDLLALAGFRENTYVTKYDSGKVHPDANGMEYIASKIYKDYGSWMEQ